VPQAVVLQQILTQQAVAFQELCRLTTGLLLFYIVYLEEIESACMSQKMIHQEIYQVTVQILTQQCSAVHSCCCCWLCFIVFVHRNIIIMHHIRMHHIRRGCISDLPRRSSTNIVFVGRNRISMH
jgi:hypothetical protein